MHTHNGVSVETTMIRDERKSEANTGGAIHQTRGDVEERMRRALYRAMAGQHDGVPVNVMATAVSVAFDLYLHGVLVGRNSQIGDDASKAYRAELARLSAAHTTHIAELRDRLTRALKTESALTERAQELEEIIDKREQVISGLRNAVNALTETLDAALDE